MISKKKFYSKKLKISKKKELPNNSRVITDKFINDHTVFFLGVISVIIAITLVSYDFYSNLKKQETIFLERKKIVSDLNFWNKEVIEKPNYRDGYFSLSLIYYQLGDYKNSLENVNKALNIDPNFGKGKELKLKLENR